jgi:hypothetical protein
MNNLPKIVSSLSFIMFFSVAFSVNASDSLKDRIEISLHPFVTYGNTIDTKVFLYCPETPCYPIQAPINTEDSVFYEYILLYLFNESGLPEFHEPGYKMPSGISPNDEFVKDVGEIESKYQKCCIGDRKITALQFLGEKYKITLSKPIVEKY